MSEKQTARAIPGAEELVLSGEVRARLSEHVRVMGENHVREALRVSRNAFGRVLAGLPVRLGTIALVERGLEQLVSPRP